MSDYLAARSRPLGVSILSVLLFVGSVLTLCGIVIGGYFLATSSDAALVQSRLEALGIPLPLLIVSTAFIVLLNLGSGVGLWTGRKWGWYLATFSYAYVIVRNLNAIFITYQIVAAMPAYEIAVMPHSPLYHYVKFSGRIVVSTLIYLYLFKSNVREYFQVSDTSGWKVVIANIVICAAILAIVSIVTPELR